MVKSTEYRLRITEYGLQGRGCRGRKLPLCIVTLRNLYSVLRNLRSAHLPFLPGVEFHPATQCGRVFGFRGVEALLQFRGLGATILIDFWVA